MKWLFVDTYYPQFLNQFYGKAQVAKSFSKAREKLLKERFGTSDFYSYHLEKLGEDVQDIIPNDHHLQHLWEKEHGHNYALKMIVSLPLAMTFMKKWKKSLKVLDSILLDQVRTIRPDVLYIKTLPFLSEELLQRLKEHAKITVGQVAYNLPRKSLLQQFDLLISSLPNLVEKFRRWDIASEYLPYAFDGRVLDEIKPRKQAYDVVFVGGFAKVHQSPTKLLEQVAREVDIDVWGYGVESLSSNSPLQKHYHGQAWGKKMYEIFAMSKIVINRHSEISGEYANNMRMFETTGVGSFLITEMKKNITDFFIPGKEIETYSSPEELVKKTKYYLRQDGERKKIAKAGQKKTLKDHTYAKRMKKLLEIIREHIEAPWAKSPRILPS